MKKLFSFLFKVSQHADKNMMSPANLTTCFAPNLLIPPVETIESLVGDSAYVNTVIRLVLEEQQQMFE